MTASENLLIEEQPTLNSSRKEFFIEDLATQSSTVMVLIFQPRLSDKAKAFIAKLNSFSNLQKNWDGYGAEPPSIENIENAIELVKRADKNMLPLYFVAPGPNGEIVVEFKKDQLEASVFFNEDGTSELIVREGNKYLLEGGLESYNRMLELFN